MPGISEEGLWETRASAVETELSGDNGGMIVRVLASAWGRSQRNGFRLFQPI
jgi:hypothetical protein